MTLNELYQNCLKRLMDLYELQEAKAVVDRLVENYSGLSRIERALNAERVISEEDQARYFEAVEKLIIYTPIQYILGETWFMDLKFSVSPSVLIPRPETEELVMHIINYRKKKNVDSLKILDIGTGSGCIAVSLKKHLPFSEITAVDVSPMALSVAKSNAIRNEVEINFVEIDILQKENWKILPEYDIVVSNPPYVTQSDKAAMMPNVLLYEPPLALYVEDDDPLIFYRTILIRSQTLLKTGGMLWFEINEAFGDELKVLCERNGYIDINIIFDFNGKSRFLHCTK